MEGFFGRVMSTEYCCQYLDINIHEGCQRRLHLRGLTDIRVHCRCCNVPCVCRAVPGQSVTHPITIASILTRIVPSQLYGRLLFNFGSYRHPA